MNHRHLLPDEIDLLLDEAVGFGVSPLKAHIAECADCRARVDDARLVVESLEDIPHFAPSHTFADRVMAEVPVFEPWHVAARDAVRRWLPQSSSARAGMLALMTTTASVLTLSVLWIATQTDVLVFATDAIGSGLRGLLGDAARQVGEALFGGPAVASIQQFGTLGIAAAILGLAAAAGGTFAGLRAMATASRRRRS